MAVKQEKLVTLFTFRFMVFFNVFAVFSNVLQFSF